jgi:hypothetical protein
VARLWSFGGDLGDGGAGGFLVDDGLVGGEGGDKGLHGDVVARSRVAAAGLVDQREGVVGEQGGAAPGRGKVVGVGSCRSRRRSLGACVAQPDSLVQLKALPWKNVPPAHTSTTRAHGRVEQRCVKVVTVATGIVFPHAHQAIQITRKPAGSRAISGPPKSYTRSPA